MVKLIHFSNNFGMTFIVRLTLPRSGIIGLISFFLGFEMRHELAIQFNNDTKISMCRASMFSSEGTMVFFFNIIMKIIISANPTSSSVFKIFISHHKFFVKCFFITSLQYLLSFIILLRKL